MPCLSQSWGKTDSYIHDFFLLDSQPTRTGLTFSKCMFFVKVSSNIRIIFWLISFRFVSPLSMTKSTTRFNVIFSLMGLLAWSEIRRQQYVSMAINSLRPRQNRRHFADDIFQCIFLNENVWISIKISLKFVPKGPINNIPALVQIMAWRRPGDKPLSEPMMVRSTTHICVTRPQWVNQWFSTKQQ